jgi:hypothetical protein
VLNTKVSILDQTVGSRAKSDVKTTVGVGPQFASASVWPAGRANPGFLGFQLTRNIPVGAILAGSTGDLVFAVNASNPFSDILSRGGIPNDFYGSVGNVENWDTVVIYLPPGFTLSRMDGLSVVTAIGGAKIQVFRASQFDPYAPGWTVICATVDPTASPGHVASTSSDSDIRAAARDYYIRLKQVTAPHVSGKYFFKIALLNRKGTLVNHSGELAGNSTELGVKASDFIISENWPTLYVKGEIDPALITGTLRYGDRAPSLRGSELREAGLVWAHMEAKIDPYTGQQITQCPAMGQPSVPGCTDAVSYFNASSKGHYELFGVAPGVYTIYAQAAGFPTMIIASGVQVMRGASLQFDGYLQPGPVIHGDVLAKSQSGDDSWAENAEIRIELFNAPTLYLTPDYSAQVVSSSPSNIVGMENALARTRSPREVGPPQYWFVQGGRTTPFHFEFGVKGEYGAPRDLDGMVPQRYATWVNGLTPGRYYARAWVSHYTQSNADGVFLECHFDVKPQEWAGEIPLKIELRRER